MGTGWSLARAKTQLVRASFDIYRAAEQRIVPRLAPPSREVSGRSYAEIPVSERVLALTFDDGPHPSNTPRLLEILETRGVKATFYLIGQMVDRYPDIARRTFGDGHEIGNHTWSHRFLTLQTTRGVEQELAKTHDAITAATGSPPVALRPPFGAITPSLSRWVRDRFGYPTISWSLDAADWEGPDPETISERLLAGARSGSIMLAHDPLTATVEAMGPTLDRLLDSGYRFVTVGELIDEEVSPLQ